MRSLVLLAVLMLVGAGCGTGDDDISGIGEIVDGGPVGDGDADGNGDGAGGEDEGPGGDGQGDGDTEDDGMDLDGGGDGEPVEPGLLRTPLAEERPIDIPDRFWAVEDGSFDLVEVSSADGQVVRRLGGWGPEAAQAELPQVLSTVEADPTGPLWIDDCCEPAFGTVYRVGPDETFSLPDETGQVESWTGLSPQVSPDGTRVALAVGDAIFVADAATGTGVAGADAVVDLLVEDLGLPFRPFARPVAWIRADVVLVLVPLDDAEVLRAVRIGDGEVDLVGPTHRFGQRVVAADVRTDGHLVVGLADPEADPASAAVAGRVIDPDTGAVVAAFDLPPGTVDLDYDPTGTFLITVDVDGRVTWLGRGRSGVSGQGFLSVSW